MSSCPLFSRIKVQKQSPGVIKIFRMSRRPLFSLTCRIKEWKQSPGVIKIFWTSSCPLFSLEVVRHRIYDVIFCWFSRQSLIDNVWRSSIDVSVKPCQDGRLSAPSRRIFRLYMVLVSQKQPLEYNHHVPIDCHTFGSRFVCWFSKIVNLTWCCHTSSDILETSMNVAVVP